MVLGQVDRANSWPKPIPSYQRNHSTLAAPAAGIKHPSRGRVAIDPLACEIRAKRV